MGLLSKELLSTRLYAKNARNLFMQVSESRNRKILGKQKYTILNYPRIVREMYEFIDGYIECKASGEYKYRDTAFGTTIQFYNKMFTDKGYRREVTLDDIPDMMKQFLEWTNKLQDVMEKHLNELNVDTEMRSMFELTNNQYRKLAKVNHDDMEIYMWLVFKQNLASTAPDLPGTLRAAYLDESTPVMHEIKEFRSR